MIPWYYSSFRERSAKLKFFDVYVNAVRFYESHMPKSNNCKINPLNDTYLSVIAKN